MFLMFPCMFPTYLIVDGHIALICPAFNPEVRFYGRGELCRICGFVVPQGDIRASLCQGSSDFKANPTSSACDDGGFAMHVEHIENAIREWRGWPFPTDWSA